MRKCNPLFLRIFKPAGERRAWHAHCITLEPPHGEPDNMTLQLGQTQLVLELSKAPFAWFQGRTERMRLTSLSLLFVQFSVFARQSAA
jgi:hypothetical protein